jgi:acetoin utilization deacetylase AcuC-like enzyme
MNILKELKLFYCDHHHFPLPEGHKFPLEKYRMLRETLTDIGAFEIEAAPIATTDEVLQIHDGDFPWSPELVKRTLASAAEHARLQHGLRRIAVVDLDVHQGDGAAAIFAADDGVFTLSLHGERNFPFRKQHSTLDVDRRGA